MQNDFEKEYLDGTLEYINKMLDKELADFDDLLMNYRRSPERFAVPYKIACDRIKVLKSGLLKPYFARIDFKDDRKEEKEKFYIGKYALLDDNNNVVIVDWRAPIANLYYDSELGDVIYECPEGEVSGKLYLKRQFEIEDGKLLNYHDVDIVSNDQLLQKYLQVNNEMRLKNIVSTIQKEQNYAIRKPLRINTIVQGVAGSGKTTIALHRIAYLVYNYKNVINNNQYMVIGPNKVFLNYIQSVLPDLDVSDVKQLTFEELAKDIIDDDFELNSSSKALNQHLLKKCDDDISKFKSSDTFRTMLDIFLSEYFNNIINDGLIIKDFEVISKEDYCDMFDLAKHGSQNFDEVLEKFVLLASDYVLNNSSDISVRLMREMHSEFDKATTQVQKEEIRSKQKYIYNEIEKGCKQSIRKTISKYKVTPIKLYRKFIDTVTDYGDDVYSNLDLLKRKTLANIKSKTIDFEDLAALMHLKCNLGLDREFKNYRHVVIDEAQDLGKFCFYALKECLPYATFSIYGDIAQSIYDYRSIDSWQEVQDVFPNSELISFRKSYRTTDEIMSIANSVAEYLQLDASELSIRHGSDVTFTNLDSNDIPGYINEKISEYKAKGYKTIAIISKYSTQSNYINDDLSFIGRVMPNIDERTDITTVDMSNVTIPNFLSKGLEFDAVIINDASEKIYDSSSSLDMKMLYVALTRALHEMDVVYSDEITKPLEKFINNKTLIKK